jgi:hypothetical protein
MQRCICADGVAPADTVLCRCTGQDSREQGHAGVSRPSGNYNFVFSLAMNTNTRARSRTFDALFKPHPLLDDQSAFRPASRPQPQIFSLSGYDTQNTLHGNNVCQAHQSLVSGVQRLLGLRVLTPCALDRQLPKTSSFQVSPPNQQRPCRIQYRGMAQCLNQDKADIHGALPLHINDVESM